MARPTLGFVSLADEALVFLHQMEWMARCDEAENEVGGAAEHKLEMLDAVVETLGQTRLREALLTHDLFTHLHRWLSRLPDGSLPHIRVRS